MRELSLKYGTNPGQKPAKIFVENGDLPFEILNGQAGYINLLDALNAWQLVMELKTATNLPAAASFKHVSPAGAALGLPLSPVLRQIYFVDENAQLSPIACAYARARGADRMSSYGDFVALSETCDKATALLLQNEVSDGIIAPNYTGDALEILKTKRSGTYSIIKMDIGFTPKKLEEKDVFGLRFSQGRNSTIIEKNCLENIVTTNKFLSEQQRQNLLLALITTKYTQSNSICYAKDGQAIGVGAGQQSRIHCTRLAGGKADIWHLRQHPKVLGLPFVPNIKKADRDNAIDIFLSDEWEDLLCNGNWRSIFSYCPDALETAEKKCFLGQINDVALASDAFFPFGDNVQRAKKSGVSCIAQPGGSIRDDNVIETCNKYGIAMAFTGFRLFFH